MNVYRTAAIEQRSHLAFAKSNLAKRDPTEPTVRDRCKRIGMMLKAKMLALVTERATVL